MDGVMKPTGRRQVVLRTARTIDICEAAGAAEVRTWFNHHESLWARGVEALEAWEADDGFFSQREQERLVKLAQNTETLVVVDLDDLLSILHAELVDEAMKDDGHGLVAMMDRFVQNPVVCVPTEAVVVRTGVLTVLGRDMEVLALVAASASLDDAVYARISTLCVALLLRDVARLLHRESFEDWLGHVASMLCVKLRVRIGALVDSGLLGLDRALQR